MIQPVKLLFDECLGIPLLDDIKKMLAWDTPEPTIHHISKYFELGTKDQDWIPTIANEEWIILTADRGKKGRAKLPAICLSYKITHILMTGSVHKLRQSEKAFAIIGLWEEIKKCGDAPKGTRFIMRMTNERRFSIKVWISKQKVIGQAESTGDK